VVVPVWGDYTGKLLTEAIASLQGQDLAAHIIVVDNASEPPLADIPAVQVVRSDERLSVGAARNLGLEHVQTSYVVFWDADDLMLPGTLGFLAGRIASDPDAVLVAASIMEGDPPVPHRWPRRWSYGLARRRSLFAFGHCIWSLFPTTGSSIMRTAAVRECGYADTNSGEDWVLGVSLVFRGSIVLASRPGRIYRRHSSSLWETQRSLIQLTRHARAVRDRIRNDPEAPYWVRLLLPAITALQLVFICVLHPLASGFRAVRPIQRSGA
jgi:glycosyltransferase involved in cell wall biosynthesis